MTEQMGKAARFYTVKKANLERAVADMKDQIRDNEELIAKLTTETTQIKKYVEAYEALLEGEEAMTYGNQAWTHELYELIEMDQIAGTYNTQIWKRINEYIYRRMYVLLDLIDSEYALTKKDEAIVEKYRTKRKPK